MKNVCYTAFLLFVLTVNCTLAQPPGATIDVQHYIFNIDLNDNDNTIACKAKVALKFIKNAKSFNLDLVKKNAAGKGMLVTSVTENGKAINFLQNADNVSISAAGVAGSTHTYSINYSGIPADGLIISTNKYGKRTFFGDNWPNRAHNWLVSVDHPADKASVDFVVSAPAHYDVIANGLKVNETPLPQNKKQTHWRETAQLSTKIMVIGVADFAIQQSANINGLPVYNYVFPQDSVKGFKSYAYAKEILPFFINKIGPYAYKKLANVQSKTIFGGMENAGAIFYFEDSPGSRDIESLMAHEIAHQWFGDAASEKNFYNLWLSEGFATYLTHYYLENKYGIDTLKKRLIADRIKVTAFEKDRFTPVVDSTVKDNYMPLLNANSYEKGSWVLHMLRRKLGDEVFWKGIKQYYALYNGKNANTDDFRKVMEKASGKELAVFFKQWLKTAGHPVLKISYDTSTEKGKIVVKVEQQQPVLYEMPLEYIINKQSFTVNIKNRLTTFKVQLPINEITFDPNVNTLAEIIMADATYRVKK
ncbi:M1 family metallopeptidase [Mucilaginibacter calamicampi]|uniref:Aminopeptidase N n=1 Tax=Mucilaginibacter calamicampi TaxID=1302352 RepID=A0ABW2Z2T2_9SPHI